MPEWQFTHGRDRGQPPEHSEAPRLSALPPQQPSCQQCYQRAHSLECLQNWMSSHATPLGAVNMHGASAHGEEHAWGIGSSTRMRILLNRVLNSCRLQLRGASRLRKTPYLATKPHPLLLSFADDSALSSAAEPRHV